MATTEECRTALEQLSHNLAAAGGDIRKAAALDRSLSCHLTDLDLTFTGRLADGRLTGITEAPGPPATKADIKLTTTGDDLVALVAGTLPFPTAWATGRLKLDASLRDLLRLRTLL
ncbi:alkyl sulfatase C-terminal domain-containing protein [Kitasatospora fiedleri]|uniref:alkyl sulfatase C-terminal domain-containing protein n=1 Tax=Kitasatospora fiedleri TaxID=2991545 RepID=UPI00249A9FE3|nr:alkyl sulfatase C-terminal domain-containing protein [Kitasatospora fiedleri]